MGFEPTLTHVDLQGIALTNCPTYTNVFVCKKIIIMYSNLTNPTTNTDDIIRRTGSSFA